MEIREATVLPIKGSPETPFTNTLVFSIDGEAGIYRRVSRDGRQGVNKAPGNVVAIVDKIHLLEFVRWTAAEQVLLPLIKEPVVTEDSDGDESTGEGPPSP